MDAFTLSTALKIIVRHFLVTVVLFTVALLSLPSLNILDNRYEVEKVIKPGSYPPGRGIDLLDHKEMSEIISSPYMGLFLKETLGSSGISSYKINVSIDGITAGYPYISLTLKGKDSNVIINTANTIMQRLKEFDRLEIQKDIILLNETLNKEREFLQIMLSSVDEFSLTKADIEQHLAIRKIYDAAYETDVVNTSDFNSLRNFKIDDTVRNIDLKKQIINKVEQLETLERFIDEGYKEVSFLFPLSAQEITKYYPNNIIFVGYSLLVAFFYNLIILNILYIRSKKPSKSL